MGLDIIIMACSWLAYSCFNITLQPNYQCEGILLMPMFYLAPLYVFLSVSSFEDVLRLLNPLFKYILVHPTPSSDIIVTASHLYMSLLTMALSDDYPSLPILRILTALLPLTPTHSQQHILTLSNRIEVFF